MRSRYLPALLVAGAAFSVSCVHQTQAGNAKVTAPVVSVWDRQVRNAIDGGDGDYQLRVLREKVASEPDNIPVRLELAKAYRERGFHEVSLEISRLAVARFPQSGDAQLSLVRDLREAGRRPEAIAGLESFLQANPDSGAGYYSWLGILRDESGLWPLGEPAHRKAVERSPSTDYLHNNLGYNLLMQKKSEEAAREFEAAFKLNPGSQMARNNLGLALAQSNAPAQAVANWQAVSNPATAHNNLAAVWMEKGNYAEARRELDLALSYNRAHPAAIRNLELVGRLDGKPATLSVRPMDLKPLDLHRMDSQRMDTGWERWKAGIRKLFVGPLDDSRTETPQSAASRVQQ